MGIMHIMGEPSFNAKRHSFIEVTLNLQDLAIICITQAHPARTSDLLQNA